MHYFFDFPGIYAPEPQMAKNTGGKPCLQSLKKHTLTGKFSSFVSY